MFRMSPAAIEVLIYFHVSPCYHPNREAPVVKEAISFFLKRGLIVKAQNESRGKGSYTTTSKGAAHIKQLVNTDFPEQQWIDAQGDVIE